MNDVLRMMLWAWLAMTCLYLRVDVMSGLDGGGWVSGVRGALDASLILAITQTTRGLDRVERGL